MTIECNDCIYRNNWNEQSKYPDCNLDNDSSECKDYKTRQQFESEEIPEWLKTGIETMRRYALPNLEYANGFHFALDRLLSLKKPEE